MARRIPFSMQISALPSTSLQISTCSQKPSSARRMEAGESGRTLTTRKRWPHRALDNETVWFPLLKKGDANELDFTSLMKTFVKRRFLLAAHLAPPLPFCATPLLSIALHFLLKQDAKPVQASLFFILALLTFSS